MEHSLLQWRLVCDPAEFELGRWNAEWEVDDVVQTPAAENGRWSRKLTNFVVVVGGGARDVGPSVEEMPERRAVHDGVVHGAADEDAVL